MEEMKKKRIERALKFGLPSKELEEEKRRQRAEKFGMATKPTNKSLVSEEERQKREMRAVYRNFRSGYMLIGLPFYRKKRNKQWTLFAKGRAAAARSAI